MIIMKQELIELICRKSFQYSQEPVFKLVSGRMSQFYVNCKPTTLHPRGMFLAGNLMFEAIKGKNVSAVGGLTFGADPIAVATAFASELGRKPVKAFSIRKNQKDHGIVKWIEGDIKPGERVAIIVWRWLRPSFWWTVRKAVWRISGNMLKMCRR
jgi:orotate phosphoribosyltransferase